MSGALPGWLVAGARVMNAVAGLRGGDCLSIVNLHRVLPEPDPLFPGEVDEVRFDRIVSLLVRSFRVLSLGDAVRRLADGTLPGRALVITFDDGYADNAGAALSILKRHRACATFFIATDFLDGGRMWNDSVIECLRRSTKPMVDLAAFGAGPMPLGNAAERRAAIEAVLPHFKYMPLARREEALAILHHLCGAPALPDDLMMGAEDVRRLQREGMEIGAHTARHPILTMQTDAEAEDEIRRGRDALVSLLGTPVPLFAYPNGRPGRDYDARHVAMVARLGFVAAVSTATGVADARSPRHELPRFTPWDADLARWAGRLIWNRWQGQRPPPAPMPTQMATVAAAG